VDSNPLLDGVTVLDLSSVGPASRASRWLADYGARVVKVGPTSRRGGVQIEPPFFSYGAGRGFERVRIDLKAEGGREAFLRLATEADVVLESFRPGVVDRIGIGYDAVRSRNPGIVYCSTSGYGQDGPYAQRAGHDLNYLAVGGFLHCSGRGEGGAPTIPGATVADSAAGGMHAAMAILAALLRRARGGTGGYLDVSVADGVLALMSLHVDEHLATGAAPGPGTNILTGRFACYDVYETRDGGWLSVAAIEPTFFANLCRALDLERWIPHQTEDARQEEIRADLREAFRQRDRDSWVAELADADCCVAPVYAIHEVTDDPHFASRGAFCRAQHEEHGVFRQVAPVFAGAARDLPVHRVRAPEQTDTRPALRRAGLSDEEIEKLLDEGAIE
jgi:alpha-methylacyl-CoA racemase